MTILVPVEMEVIVRMLRQEDSINFWLETIDLLKVCSPRDGVLYVGEMIKGQNTEAWKNKHLKDPRIFEAKEIVFPDATPHTMVLHRTDSPVGRPEERAEPQPRLPMNDSQKEDGEGERE